MLQMATGIPWDDGYLTTAQDYARFGLLYLRGGEWDGEQILPEDWVEYSRTPSPAEPEYGAHWWLDPRRPGVFYAVGIRGNVITVDPAHDLVIAAQHGRRLAPAHAHRSHPRRLCRPRRHAVRTAARTAPLRPCSVPPRG